MPILFQKDELKTSNGEVLLIIIDGQKTMPKLMINALQQFNIKNLKIFLTISLSLDRNILGYPISLFLFLDTKWIHDICCLKLIYCVMSEPFWSIWISICLSRSSISQPHYFLFLKLLGFICKTFLECSFLSLTDWRHLSWKEFFNNRNK